MELSERKLKILQAIIADFIATAEPIGSRTLSKKYDMGISPATIRNEMSDLEDMGYLTHPHTSAGRVPSEKAYRLYVNELMDKKKLTAAQKRRINNELNKNINEFEKAIRHATSILSEITNLTSFAVTPTPDEDILEYINLIPVDPRTVVLMIVSESGTTKNTVLRLDFPYDERNLELLAKSLTYNFRGKTISEALTSKIIDSFENDIEAMQGLMHDVMPSFMKTLENMLNVNLYMEGLSNIFALPEYSDIDRARSFMQLLDRKEDIKRKLIDRDNGVIITIGGENADENMSECSVITATYHVDGKLAGKIGVIGPTRMRYGEVTSVIEYLTDNLNRSFKLTESEEDNDQ